MNRKIPTKSEPRSAAREYWKKSEDFSKGMNRAYEDNNWNSVALQGIHALICAADSILISLKGQKSSSERHLDVSELISSLPVEGAKQASSHLVKILSLKSTVEYTGDQFSDEDANKVRLAVERFLNWAKKVLPPTILSGR